MKYLVPLLSLFAVGTTIAAPFTVDPAVVQIDLGGVYSLALVIITALAGLVAVRKAIKLINRS